ncbi:MAG TPA: ANTAR domain-containing protein [Methylomirabilota bacterium]
MGILDADARSRGELSRLIEARGGQVVVDSPPRADSVDLLRRMEPDAVVLATDDGASDSGVTAHPLGLDLSTAVVLLAGPASPRALRFARAAGVMGVLMRPLRAGDVGPTLEIAIARFRELRRLRRALADRPVVEQAKAALMAREGLSEPAAFGWLRRRAMEQRIRIGEMARSVLGNDAR